MFRSPDEAAQQEATEAAAVTLKYVAGMCIRKGCTVYSQDHSNSLFLFLERGDVLTAEVRDPSTWIRGKDKQAKTDLKKSMPGFAEMWSEFMMNHASHDFSLTDYTFKNPFFCCETASSRSGNEVCGLCAGCAARGERRIAPDFVVTPPQRMPSPWRM